MGVLRRGAAVLAVGAVGLLAASPGALAQPTTGEPPAAVAAPIDGWVADGATGQPLGGVCVVFYYVDGKDAWNGFALTSGDGSWSFTPAVSGAQRIATFRPSVDGDCTSMPLASGPVPEWAFDVGLRPADPLTAVPPAESSAIADGTNGIGICLGDAELHRGRCELAPPGSETISGNVVQPGPVPVGSACVFALAEIAGETKGFDAIADAEGRYAIGGLPADTPFYLVVAAPFVGDQGPCETSNGPPPAPAADDLQPEFYANVWVDLSSAEVDADPTAYAEARGAVAVAASASGIDVCLTTEPGSTATRSACTAPAATPVSSPVSDPVSFPVSDPVTYPVSDAPPAAVAVSATLPLTGGGRAATAAAGASLVTLGVAAVLASRRRPAPRQR